MSTGERLDAIRTQIADSESVPSLRDALRLLKELETDVGTSPGIDEIRLDALDRLARMTLSDPAIAADSIVAHLLPAALRAKAEAPSLSVALQYSEWLSDWINNIPATSRNVARERILNELAGELSGHRVERACRLIIRIGYRSEPVTRLLWQIVTSRPDELGDTALLALVALGVPAESKPEIVAAWRTRAEQRWNNELIAAAQALAARECLEVVFEAWLLTANLPAQNDRKALLPELTLAIPAAIAEKHVNEPPLQEEIWARLRNLDTALPTLVRKRLLGSDQLGPACNTPHVVSYYLERMPEGERSRDLAFFRLEKCVRPKQLQGWAAGVPDSILEALRQEMSAATGMPGQYVTQEFRRKLYAWRALFALGRRDPLEDLGRTLLGEHNGYAVGALLEEAAAFRSAPLPQLVHDLIGGRFDGMIPDEGGRVSAHISAIAVAHASESRSAFNALMGFTQVKAKGGVLLSLVDALADNAESVIYGGDSGVLTDLWASTRSSNPAPRRTAATAAIGRLIRKRVILPTPATDVLGVLNDDTLDVYARREVVDAIGTISPDSVPAPVVDAIRKIATPDPVDNASPGKGEGQALRAAALGTLARLGLLESDTELLSTAGFRAEDGVWRLDPERPPTAGLASIVGFLYLARPGEFTPAVCEVLANGNWVAVSQLAPTLEAGPKPIPEPIYSALLGRVRRASTDAAETHLISLLGRLAADRLATESWAEMFSWPPQTREALADALAASPPEIAQKQRTGLLVVLMGDGQYGVRRAAYRALGRVDPTGLNSLCSAWASLTEDRVLTPERPFVVDLRRRAAEGAAWLSVSSLDGVLAGLETDPEPEVRETFARCQRERRTREWAAMYTQEVLAVHDDTSLLRAWRYGLALQSTGDDVSLERLEQHRRRTKLSPGIRHWLARIIKAIRSRWDEETRGWPQPWFARQGRLEHLSAVIPGYAAEKAIPCWLWAVAETDRISWGGWCTDVSMQVGEGSLHVEGRPPSKIIVTQSIAPGGPSYFVGSGPYPGDTGQS